MPGLKLPPEFAPEAAAALTHHAEHPATRHFLALVRAGVRWSPNWPRWILRCAARSRITVSGPQFARVLLTGFAGLRPRPHYLAGALFELGRLKFEMLGGGSEEIYAGGREFRVWGEDPPGRDPAAAFMPRPVQYAGPADLAALAAATPPSEPSANQPPPTGTPPRPSIVTRAPVTR